MGLYGVAERLLCGDDVERAMWTAVLEETISVRLESSGDKAPAPAPGVGVTDLDADVERALHNAVRAG